MSNRLSFAQILQKKKTPDQNKGAQNTIGQLKNQKTQFNSPQCSTQLPSLVELMSQYLQYPDEPEQTYILNFSDFDQGFHSVGSSQDFESGINPLDSWIMTQSKFNNPKQKHQKIPNELMKYSQNKPGNDRSYMMNNRRAKLSKQNKNANLGNADNVFKFGTKTPKQRSMESSSNDFNMNDSYKYGPTSPSAYRKPVSNKTMIVDTKIIQSQAYHPYHHVSPCQSKKDVIPKMERSEKVQRKQSDKSNYSEVQENVPMKKPPRYQQNYQDTDRKQQPKPPIQQSEPAQQKLIISKKQSHKMNTYENPEQKKPTLKISKKQSQQQQLLLAGIDQTPQNVMPVMSEQQKRIQEAKKQITEYLSIKQKQPTDMGKDTESKRSPNQPTFSKQITKVAEVAYIPPIQQQKINTSKLVNYSFANNEGLQANPGPVESFAQQTKQELKQIEEQNRTHENERMLSCIEYTQSEADNYEEIEQENSAIEYKRNIETSQSIPQKRVNQISEPCTLQKYLPPKQISNQPSQNSYKQVHPAKDIPFERKLQLANAIIKQSEGHSRLQELAKACHEQSEQYSQMMQKVQVQPSIVHEQEPSSLNDDQKEKDDESLNVMNSDHPRFRELSERELFKSQQIPDRETKPVYHDVSSIDIYISESSNQSPSNQKNIQMIVPPEGKSESKQIQIPKLNLKISDISSVSNQSHLESHPSPIKASTLKQSPIEYHSDHKNDSQVESQQPLSSHDSMNLQAHTNGYGFIYAMRVNSRNGSFTSNYNKSVSQSQNQSYCSSFNKSNHSSLIIKEDPVRAEESFGFAGEEINMNKNKANNQKYLESEPFARDQAVKSFCGDSLIDCESPTRNEMAEAIAEAQEIIQAPQEVIQQSVAVEQIPVQASNQQPNCDDQQSMALERVLVQVSKIQIPQASENVKAQCFEQQSLIYKLNEENLVCSEQNPCEVVDHSIVDKINSFQAEGPTQISDQAQPKVAGALTSQLQNSCGEREEKILQETVSATAAPTNSELANNQDQSAKQIYIQKELKIQKTQSEPILKQQAPSGVETEKIQLKIQVKQLKTEMAMQQPLQLNVQEPVPPSDNIRQESTTTQDIKSIQPDLVVQTENQQQPSQPIQETQKSQIKPQEINEPAQISTKQSLKEQNSSSNSVPVQVQVVNACQKENQKPIGREVGNLQQSATSPSSIDKSISPQANSLGEAPKQEARGGVDVVMSPTYTLKASLKPSNVLGSSMWGNGLRMSIKNSIGSSKGKEEEAFKFDLDF